MKKRLLCLSFVFSMLSCLNNTKKPSYDSFKNVWGLVYFQLPEAGSSIDAVFVPLKDSDEIKKYGSALIYKASFKQGIKFSTTNSDLNKAFYFTTEFSINNHNKSVYYNLVKIHYHLDPIFTPQHIIDKDLYKDILIFKKEKILTQYYLSNITIDSITIRNANKR